MTPRKPKPRAVFANRTASVSVHRNGLTIEVANVPAEDAGIAAKELLDVVRTLVAAGYEELIVEQGSLHGGVVDQAEEYDGPDGTEPPSARSPRRVGF